MKQELCKLKGTTISTVSGEITLCQTYRYDDNENDCLYFFTNMENMLAKVYDLQSEESQQRFNRQKVIYRDSKYKQIAVCAAYQEFKNRKQSYGLILLNHLKKKSSLKDNHNTLNNYQLLKIAKVVLQFIQQLQHNNEVYLNLRPQNIVYDNNSNTKIISPQYLSQAGTHAQIEKDNSFFMGNVEKFYQYYSPQLLDYYCNVPIDNKSDIFSLGCILYESVFGVYPFESKFANINVSYTSQPNFFGQIISLMLNPYNQRANAHTLITMIEQQQTNTKPIQQSCKMMNTLSTNQSKSPQNSVGLSFFDDIQNVINKFTKQMDGAYLNYTNNTDEIPQDRYYRSLIQKVYKKQSKMERIYHLIVKHTGQIDNADQKLNFIIKNLMFILVMMREGPKIDADKWQQVLYGINKKMHQKHKIPQMLMQVCRDKITLHRKISNIFAGNFYLVGIMNFKSVTFNHLIIIIQYIHVLINIVSDILKLTTHLLKQTIIKMLCDEIYDAISIVIMSIICIRKDNDLQLRKDNLSSLKPIEVSIVELLQKIQVISLQLDNHPLYSLEHPMAYREELLLKSNPYYSSIEHFYKNSHTYKGLTLPSNYSQIYATETHKNFHSPERMPYYSYAQIEKVSPRKQGHAEFDEDYIQFNEDELPQSAIHENIKPNTDVKQPKHQLQMHPKIQNKSIKKPPSIISFEEFGAFGVTKSSFFQPKKQQIQHKAKSIVKKENNQVKMNLNKEQFNIFDGFSFKNPKRSQESKPNKQTVNSFADFSQLMQKSKCNDSKPTNGILKNKDTKLKAGTNIFSEDWLKTKKLNLKPQTQQPKKSIITPIMQQILQGLKLPQLKQKIIHSKKIIVQYQKLFMKKIIGSGSAGEVYMGDYEGKQIAIKKIKTRQNPNALKEFQRQLLTYIKIQYHPNLVSLVGLSLYDNNYYLLTEFCPQGSLFDLLHKQKNSTILSWAQKINIALQIARGMNALHSMKPAIIHRDLKSLNVFMIYQNRQWVAKVADFGLSRNIQAEMMTMALGTLHWMAPELLEDRQYSSKVDVYSYSILLWQICCRNTPYNELKSLHAIIKHVTIDHKRPSLQQISGGCPTELIDLMQQCWDHSGDNRPTFAEIVTLLQKLQIS